MRVEASAPSNIALIKYMGKVEGIGNRPANASLSLTLENLRTFVTLEEISGVEDRWEPLESFPPIQLSEGGRTKFLNHLGRLKSRWNLKSAVLVRSANNFPSDCGLASSASSFAALTLATYQWAQRNQPSLNESMQTLSALSREGSGSSCRSFFSPWAEWSGEGASPCALDLRLDHGVVIVDASKKAVSSSEAHRRILTSSLWPGRIERAEQRLSALKAALSSASQWREAYEICWAEFWDMHALFETSRPPFGFMTADTLAVLTDLRRIWTERNDGPLVTMDAGANVHLLLRPEQRKEASEWLPGRRTLWSWS